MRWDKLRRQQPNFKLVVLLEIDVRRVGAFDFEGEAEIADAQTDQVPLRSPLS